MSSPPPLSQLPGDAPVVRRSGEWWLTTATLSIRLDDPAVAAGLDRFAADFADAQQAVAALRSHQGPA
ncbi:hypothetical protein I3J09_16195 [Streptomyces clavuligerus]|nr:hypothetical protein [Streptomyces clavuligerus]QPL64252.1 hypothetical protein I3J04_16180 [Streptomyces clavuligerus]QPL70280.1 hypothetical protein I3J05_16190 [Streptomyces clavuligerus]QPL76364.1 hypothetical protein I3J06_16195 [Streptomyces clavuligerus]QPL82390.1 hypothetical protein I3J07_16235 [Streptomyces clavuligerus]